MRKRNFFTTSICFYIIFAFCISSAVANEEKKTTETKEFSGRQTEDWMAVQNQLAQLKTKLDAQKTSVEGLLKAKHQNEKMSSTEVDTLKKEHSKLQQLTVDYNALLSDFQTRFPEKGLESGRKYIRQEDQSLEEMENKMWSSLSTEGKIKRLQKKIKYQYQAEDMSMDVSKVKKHKTPVGSKSPDTPQPRENSPDVTEKIILVK